MTIKNDGEYAVQFFTLDDYELCPEDALKAIFDNNEAAMQAIINEETYDFTYRDAAKGIEINFGLEREESRANDDLPKGVYCAWCGKECVQPRQDRNGFASDYSNSKDNRDLRKSFKIEYGHLFRLESKYVYAPWIMGEQKIIACRHVLCSDGKQRYAKVWGEPLTYFSIAGAVQVQGKTVTGEVWYNDMDKIHCFTQDGDGKNASLLPAWPNKYQEVLDSVKK